MNDLLKQAQKMQEQLMEAQAAAAEQVVEGQSGGGVVKVTVTGGMEFQSVSIDPDAVDPEDVEMLQDLVTAAVNEALRQVEELAASKMGGGMGDMDPSSMLEALGGLGGGLPGGGMPGGGLPGGAPNRAARRAQKKR
jgi:nucleoid-associated protein EbfC